MNQNTRIAFIEFIDAVGDLAHAVSSVAGTSASGELLEACETLKEFIKSDETIP